MIDLYLDTCQFKKVIELSERAMAISDKRDDTIYPSLAFAYLMLGEPETGWNYLKRKRMFNKANIRRITAILLTVMMFFTVPGFAEADDAAQENSGYSDDQRRPAGSRGGNCPYLQRTHGRGCTGTVQCS